MPFSLISNTSELMKIESEIVKCNHKLADSHLFSDEQLINIFENHPKDHLQIYMMGDDHNDLENFRLGERGSLNSLELLQAVKDGQLWFNIMGIESYLPEYKNILDGLFDELEQCNPEFRTFQRRATLLVSSPNAKVFYHADGPPNILWHIRGRKKVFLYPLEAPFAKNEDIEKIFSRLSNDDLPYDASYEEHAREYVLTPGEMIAWPQNMPHRVDNLDAFCVSLSAEYFTEKSMRKRETFLANFYLRRWFNLPLYSGETRGVWAKVKRISYRIFAKLGFPLVKEGKEEFEFTLK